MNFSSSFTSFTSFAFLAFLSVTSLAALGCDEAKLTTSPDDAGCAAPQLEFGCKLQPASDPGCGPDLGTSAIFGRDVFLDSGAAATCKVIVNDLVPDEDNQCTQLGTCECDEADGGAFGWICRE